MKLRKDKWFWKFVIFLSILVVWGFLSTDYGNTQSIFWLVLTLVLYFLFIYSEGVVKND